MAHKVDKFREFLGNAVQVPEQTPNIRDKSHIRGDNDPLKSTNGTLHTHYAFLYLKMLLQIVFSFC